jgi:hypothetical protein
MLEKDLFWCSSVSQKIVILFFGLNKKGYFMVIEIVTLLVCTIYLFLVAISIQTQRIRKIIEFVPTTDKETPNNIKELKKDEPTYDRALDLFTQDELNEHVPTKIVRELSVAEKYRDAFRNYPEEAWDISVWDYKTDDQFYDYINKHIILITNTGRGLEEDMKTAYEEENKRLGGLKWFLNGDLTTIEGLYHAIWQSKRTLQNKPVNPENRKVLTQKLLDDFSRKSIGFENNLVLDEPRPNTNDLQVLNLNQFIRIQSNYHTERAAFKLECRNTNKYRQCIETIIILMGLKLKNHKSYDCEKGKRDKEYEDFKEYWDNFIGIIPDQYAKFVADTLMNAYRRDPNGKNEVFNNTESYEDKQNRVSKNMDKSTIEKIQQLDVYKQYYKRLQDLINDKGL